MAADSFDNVLCISAFGVCLGIGFDSGEFNIRIDNLNNDKYIVHFLLKVDLFILGSPRKLIGNL